MRIAIDSRITYNNDRALRMFTREFWQDMTSLQPDHNFLFISNEKTAPKFPSNVLVMGLKKTNFQWLDKKRLEKTLTEWKADKLATVQETGFIINNQPTKNKTTNRPPKKRLLFAGSINPDKASAGSISAKTILPALNSTITSLTWAEAESIKTQYTGGRSFFLFTGDIHEKHQLIELLKAFSMFKKWQQSNMQLVIAGRTTDWTGTLEGKLLTYKYKEDVVILENINTEETGKLVAASYAMVYPGAGNVFPLALLWALQSNKAIIATNNAVNRQLTNAASWIEPANTVEGFANAMKLLYKDEQQQQLLVQQTKEQAIQFNRQQMLAEAWQCIAE